MIDFLIKRPISVIMVCLALCALGLLALLRIPISILPDVDFPALVIRVEHNRGASESVYLEGLRHHLGQVPGLRGLHAESTQTGSLLKLDFEFGIDLDKAFLSVNEKIEHAQSEFHPALDRPLVLRSSSATLPVFSVVMTLKKNHQSSGFNDKFLEMSDFALKVVKRRLEQLPEIAYADMTGAGFREVQIVPKRGISEALGLSFENLKPQFENQLAKYGELDVTEGGLKYKIEVVSASFKNIHELGDISVLVKGRLTKLSDVVDINLVAMKRKGEYFFNEERAIVFSIIKQPKTSLISLREASSKLLADLAENNPEIEFRLSQDHTAILDQSIGTLQQDLLVSSLLAFIVLALFLQNISNAVLIFITVPVSLLLSILLFHALELTINVVSLSGIVLGLGLMIDNSIIIIDSIAESRKLHSNYDACVKGTMEVVKPMIASVCTTCVVFLPLIFLSGIAGTLFYDQALAVTISLLVSLLVSITLLPVLIAMVLKGSKTPKALDARYLNLSWLYKGYEAGFKFAFRYPKLLVGLGVAFMLGSWVISSRLEVARLPYLGDHAVQLDINWGGNISLGESKKRVDLLLSKFDHKSISSEVMLGAQQFTFESQTLSSSEAKLLLTANSADALQKVIDRIRLFGRDKFPASFIFCRRPPGIFDRMLGDEQTDFQIKIRAEKGQLPSPEIVLKFREELNGRFRTSIFSPLLTEEVYKLSLRQDRLLQYGVDAQQIFDQLSYLASEKKLQGLSDDRQGIPVVYREQELYGIYDLLERSSIKLSEKGRSLPISDFVNVNKAVQFQKVYSDQQGEYLQLSVQSADLPRLVEYLDKFKKGNTELVLSYSGSYFDNQELMNELWFVLAIAVVLLYFILSAQFESLMQPLIILAELPISMFGAFLLLYLTGTSLNLMSMIGLIVMSGIIINDSILKIDAINKLYRKAEFSLEDSISRAGHHRLRSILMTAIVTMLSVGPFLLGNDLGSMLQRPLSLAIIGGMLIGTPVSIYLLPVLYWYSCKTK